MKAEVGGSGAALKGGFGGVGGGSSGFRWLYNSRVHVSSELFARLWCVWMQCVYKYLQTVEH